MSRGNYGYQSVNPAVGNGPSDSSNKLYGARRGIAPQFWRIPWLSFILLTLLFFGALHDVQFSLHDNTETPIEDRIAQLAEGSIGRRVSFALLGLFGLVALVRKRGQRLQAQWPPAHLILFFLIWACMSVTWSTEPAITLRSLVVLGTFWLAAMGLTRRTTVDQIILFTLFASSVYLIAGIVAEISLGTFEPFTAGYRFAGTLHPNEQGTNCAVLALSGIATAQANTRWRGVIMVWIGVGVTFVALTGSRVAFVAILIALAGYFLLTTQISQKLMVALTVLVCAALALLFFGQTFVDGVIGVAHLGREDPLATITGRLELQKLSVAFASERPILGFGYGAFWSPDRIYEASSFLGGRISGSTSAYLELILNTGLVGMGVFVLILAVGFNRCRALYGLTARTGYAFMAMLLLYSTLTGLAYSGPVQPTFLAFLTWLALVRAGWGSIEVSS